MMNAKFSPPRFWSFHENGLIRTTLVIMFVLVLSKFVQDSMGHNLNWLEAHSYCRMTTFAD